MSEPEIVPELGLRPEPDPEPGLNLRNELPQRSVRAFNNGPLADIIVSDRSLNLRLAKMRRALVAHDALCFMLAEVGVEMPIGTLVTAISEALKLELITTSEARWLRYFNYAANQAKHHGSGLPF